MRSVLLTIVTLAAIGLASSASAMVCNTNCDQQQTGSGTSQCRTTCTR